MTTLMERIEQYRKTTDLITRRLCASAIYYEILGDISLFIFGKVSAFAAEDVIQDAMIAIITNLSAFRGQTEKEFLKWCYQIARRRIADQYRKKAIDRLEPFPKEELWYLIEKRQDNVRDWKLDKADLDDALNLLDKSKPECRKFLWNHYVLGFDYEEIAEESQLKYDAVRMKIGRCLETARALLAD